MLTLTDLRHAARLLFRDPGFSIVAIGTIALGVGLNVTVFSILNVLLLKPAPVAHANRLAWVMGKSQITCQIPPARVQFRVITLSQTVSTVRCYHPRP